MDLDQQDPRVDHSADKTTDKRRDEPVQPAATG
jgi:hypothetical protein